MDAGTKVGWTARYFEDELSAIQHAHGLRVDNPVTFEPGARTAWHTHPLGQTLIVSSGCGWV